MRECPHLCSCKWSGGKKLADCSNKGFTTIPQSISSEVQVRRETRQDQEIILKTKSIHKTQSERIQLVNTFFGLT